MSQLSPPAPFFVHVVESPSSRDLLDGRTEGRVLMEALALSQIPATYNLVTDRPTLDTAIGERLQYALGIHQTYPVLHLSLHGSNEGIALTNGCFLYWQQLREILVPINQALGGYLLVCLSSCYGEYGVLMAMHENAPLPFSALVGHPESAEWDDSAIAFMTFYHRLFKGASASDAVEAMKLASGDSRFSFTSGQTVQQGFVEHLKKKRLEDLCEALSRSALQRSNKSTGLPAPE